MSSEKRKRNFNNCTTPQKKEKKNEENSDISGIEEKMHVSRNDRTQRPTIETTVEKVNLVSPKKEILESPMCKALLNEVKDVSIRLTRIDDSMVLSQSSPIGETSICTIFHKNSPQSPPNSRMDTHHKGRRSLFGNTSIPSKTNSLVIKAENGTTVQLPGKVNHCSLCNEGMTNCDQPMKRRSIKVEGEKSPTPKTPKKSMSIEKYGMKMSPEKSCVQVYSPHPKMKTLSIMCEKLVVDNTVTFVKHLSESGRSTKRNQESPAKPTLIKPKIEANFTSEPRFIIQTRQSKLAMDQTLLNSNSSDSVGNDSQTAKKSSGNSKIHVSPRSRKQRGTPLKKPRTVVKVSLSRPKIKLRARDSGDKKTSTVKGKLNTNHLVSMVKTVRTASKLKSASRSSRKRKQQQNILDQESNILSGDVQTVCGVIIQNSDNFPVGVYEMMDNDDSLNHVKMVNNGDIAVRPLNNCDDDVNPASRESINIVNTNDEDFNLMSNGHDSVNPVKMVNNGVDVVPKINNSDGDINQFIEVTNSHDGINMVNDVENAVTLRNSVDVRVLNNCDDDKNPVTPMTNNHDGINMANDVDNAVTLRNSVDVCILNNCDDDKNHVNPMTNNNDGINMVNNVDGVNPKTKCNDALNLLSKSDGGVHLDHKMTNDDDGVHLDDMVNTGDDSLNQVNMVNTGDYGGNPVNMVNNGSDAPVTNKADYGLHPDNMVNNGDDGVSAAEMAINNDDVSKDTDDCYIFSNDEFLASLPPIEVDTSISKEFHNTDMLPNNLHIAGNVDEDLQISKMGEPIPINPEMVTSTIGSSIDLSTCNQEIISEKHKETAVLVSYLKPENSNCISSVSPIDTQGMVSGTPIDTTIKQDLNVSLYSQLPETTLESTIMQGDPLVSKTSLMKDCVDGVPNELDLVAKDNKSDVKKWQESRETIIKDVSQPPLLIEPKNVQVKYCESITETQGQQNETMSSLNCTNESGNKFQNVTRVPFKENPPQKPKKSVRIKVAFASAKAVLEEMRNKSLYSLLKPNPKDDGENKIMPSLQKTSMEHQETVNKWFEPNCSTRVLEKSNGHPKAESTATEIQKRTVNCLTKDVGTSCSIDRNYFSVSNKTKLSNSGSVNISSKYETGPSQRVDGREKGFDKTPITKGFSKVDVSKYQNVLTPEVLKQILAVSNSLKNTERKPQMLKLPNGSIIKLNFPKVGKEVNSTNTKSSTITTDSSSKTPPKSKRLKTPKFPPGWVCPFEPPQGENMATYKNREEVNNLILKCPTCEHYHCPLCEFQRFKPQPTKERVFQHIDLIHWSRKVPVIINEKEYFTVICNLLHGKKVYKKSHLHCPCGILVRYHDKRERFQYHRKYICPLTAHIRKSKGILVRKKRTPTCFKKGFPENQHRSIHDSWEDLLSSVNKCSHCGRFHCFLCPETKFLPAGRSRLVRHLKSHYLKRTQIVTSQGESGPFFIACKLKHADIRNKHYHCLCGQIMKTTIGTFRDHVRNCRIVTCGLKDKSNYTQMNIYEYEDTPLDQETTLSTVQLRMMIPRNTVPIYGPNGEKVLPPPLRSGIFRNIQEICSVVKRCYTCCTQYHCPLCPANTFRPSNRTKLASHLLRTHHKFKLPLPSGLFSYPCSLSHNGVQQRHYHCACDYLPTARLRFLKHVSLCNKALLPLHTPQMEELPTPNVFDEMKQQEVKESQDIRANIISERGDINPLNQIFENSDDEDEDEDISALGKKTYQTLCNDHAYLHNKEELIETLADHLEAKSDASEIVQKLPEVHGESRDNDAIMEPVDTILRSQEWFATNHEITNTCMSDPSRGLFNPFDLVAAQVKKCEDCCKNYHCPYCPPMYFKPNSRNAVIRHMKTHWAKRVILIDGTFALPCFINHYQMLNMHYHCLCGAIVESNSSFFYSHIRECKFVIGMAEDCRSGLQPLCQQIGESSDSDFANTGFQSLDKVVTELSSFLEENTKHPKKSASRNSPVKVGITDSQKSDLQQNSNSPKHAEKLISTHMDTESQIQETISNISHGHVEQHVIADVMESYVENDWMITANSSAEVSTNTTNFSTQSSCGLDYVESQGLEVPTTSNVTLQYEGMNYDIVMPYNGGVLDVNTLQGILPPGYSYMVID